MLRKVLLALTLIVTNAQAANWITYAESPTTEYQYDPSLVTKHDNQGKVLVLWIKYVEHSVTFMTKYELHCGSKSYRVLVDYRNNQSTNTVYQNTNKNDTWKWALPDSVEMNLIDLMCPSFN